MTHTFTPPETFPHPCQNTHNEKVILHGFAKNKNYEYIAEDVSGRFASAVYYNSDDLRDPPKVTSTWQNVYPDADYHDGMVEYVSRELADEYREDGCFKVLRRDTIDGVTTCELEPV